MNIDDAALADSLRRLSQPREDDGSITSALQVVVAACVDLFGVDGAGVLIADEQDILVYAAASDGPGRLLEQTEAEAGEGPCTEAFVQGRVVTSRDVTAESDRWPTLASCSPYRPSWAYRQSGAHPFAIRSCSSANAWSKSATGSSPSDHRCIQLL